jgi:hypothetical protein
MPTAYSVDLRVRILHDCRNGMKRQYAAKKYSISLSCVYHFCQQYKDTNNIAPKEYKHGHQQWQQSQEVLDGKKLVFIGETWVKTNMTSLYGWAERGKRLSLWVRKCCIFILIVLI